MILDRRTLLRGALGRPPGGLTTAGRRALVAELRLIRGQGYAERRRENGPAPVGAEPVPSVPIGSVSLEKFQDR